MAGQLLQLGLLWAANVVALHAVALRAYRARVGQIRAIRQHVALSRRASPLYL
jgi:hypothetical protein